MKGELKLSTSMITQLHHFDQFEKELQKLKYHLRIKHRIYNQQEFKQINARINMCQAALKKEKYQNMSQQAQSVVCHEDLSSDLYAEVKNKLQLARKVRVRTDGIGRVKEGEKFRINDRSEQSSLLENKVIMEYELTPTGLSKNANNIRNSRVRTLADEKRSNDRYVSQFEKNIKARLSRIKISNSSSYYEENDDQIVQPSRNVNPRPSKIKLPPIKTIFENRDNKKGLNRRNNYSAFKSNRLDRYYLMKEKLELSKTSLRNMQNMQIDRISQDNIDSLEKSRMLRSISCKFEDKSKNGDFDALDLMSKATLARADLLMLKEYDFQD